MTKSAQVREPGFDREAMLRHLWEAENAAKTGFDPDTGTWGTYDDGGVPAVGPGIRVQGDVPVKTHYTDDDVNALASQALDRHVDRARKRYPEFDAMDPYAQKALTDMEYNSVHAPKLYNALRAGDVEAASNEIRTHYTNAAGERIENKRRNELRQRNFIDPWAKSLGSAGTSVGNRVADTGLPPPESTPPIGVPIRAETGRIRPVAATAGVGEKQGEQETDMSEDAVKRAYFEGVAAGLEKAAKSPKLMQLVRSAMSGPKFSPQGKAVARSVAPWLAAGGISAAVTPMEYSGYNPLLSGDQLDAPLREKLLAWGANTLAFRAAPRAFGRKGGVLGTPIGQALTAGTVAGSTPAIHYLRKGTTALQEFTGDEAARSRGEYMDSLLRKVEGAVGGLEGASKGIEKDIGVFGKTLTEAGSDLSGGIRDIRGPITGAAKGLHGTTEKVEKLTETLNRVAGKLEEESPLQAAVTKFVQRLNSIPDRIMSAPGALVSAVGGPRRAAMYGGGAVATVLGYKLLSKLKRSKAEAAKRTRRKSVPAGELTSAQKRRLALETEAYELGRSRQLPIPA